MIHKLMNRPINKSFIKFVKRFSTNSYTTLKCDNDNGLAILDLHNRPVNVLKWDFLTHLNSQFKLVEKQFSALILTSVSQFVHFIKLYMLDSFIY